MGGAVIRTRALRGGMSSAVHEIAVQLTGGAVTQVVLRRYVRPEVNLEEPDIAEREQHALQLTEATDIPTPRLLGCDPTGTDAGVPSLLMSRLPGRLVWSPTHMEVWLRRLAAVLAPIHATPLPAQHGIRPFAPYEPERWDPPPWLRRPSLWSRAVDIFHGPVLDAPNVFIHRDYHPGNVLWRRGRVAGVVDWQAASIGPASIDVGFCRLNLLRRFDFQVAARFTDLCEDLTHTRYHPWAEVVLLVDVLDSGHDTPPRDQETLEGMLARALAELTGTPR
ncbi:MAG: aminoglycoside phosphotransferase family protein [Acidimicrobiia bacterium]